MGRLWSWRDEDCQQQYSGQLRNLMRLGWNHKCSNKYPPHSYTSSSSSLNHWYEAGWSMPSYRFLQILTLTSECCNRNRRSLDEATFRFYHPILHYVVFSCCSPPAFSPQLFHFRSVPLNPLLGSQKPAWSSAALLDRVYIRKCTELLQCDRLAISWTGVSWTGVPAWWV